ncbi:MAG: hypothetical protein H6540_04575 [Bacteroidales bacterium]|nr:hypothetical protein [Bacteroidales bacterium]MCB9012408.1 hypothetical protein [Bacteroidales bacterium]
MGNPSRFEITEIFMAKAGKNGWDRCFHGTIRRETDADGNPIVIGKIKVNDGYIIARARNQWELGEELDEMVLMVLDKGLHQDSDVSIRIFGSAYNLN